MASMTSTSERAPVVDWKLNRNNWLFEHPVWTDIQSFGFEDSRQQRVSMTVYLDLCEAKDWCSVKVHKCSLLQVVYLSGKSQRKSPVEFVLPLPADTELSHDRIQEFLQNIPADVDQCDGEKSLTLAISDSDSSTVYYKVTNGFALPDNVITSHTIPDRPVQTEGDIFAPEEL